jgi:hypothetical protein
VQRKRASVARLARAESARVCSAKEVRSSSQLFQRTNDPADLASSGCVLWVRATYPAQFGSDH